MFEDSYTLHDKLGKVKITEKDLVTGIVVGISGKLSTSSKFSVEEVVFNGPPPQNMCQHLNIPSLK